MIVANKIARYHRQGPPGSHRPFNKSSIVPSSPNQDGPLRKPGQEQFVAWQAAMDAYSQCRQHGNHHFEADRAAMAAYERVHPGDPDRSRQVIRAVAYGAQCYGSRFYTG